MIQSQGFHIRLLHPTFGYFLLGHQSCDNHLFSIDKEKAHRGLFTDCLELMSQHLKADICDLRLLGTLMSEVDKLEVERHLSLRFSTHAVIGSIVFSGLTSNSINDSTSPDDPGPR